MPDEKAEPPHDPPHGYPPVARRPLRHDRIGATGSVTTSGWHPPSDRWQPQQRPGCEALLRHPPKAAASQPAQPKVSSLIAELMTTLAVTLHSSGFYTLSGSPATIQWTSDKLKAPMPIL